jgi:hypothetical protein
VTLRKVTTHGARSVTYRLVLKGEMGDRFGFLFSDMSMSRVAGVTVMEGPVTDQAHLAGLIERAQELGLELISVAKLDDPSGFPGEQS